MQRVIVKMGRNAGKTGTVIAEAPNAVLVDFGGTIRIDEGFGSYNDYPDHYWVPKKSFEYLEQKS